MAYVMALFRYLRGETVAKHDTPRSRQPVLGPDLNASPAEYEGVPINGRRLLVQNIYFNFHLRT
jgi:hypothetical protein